VEGTADYDFWLHIDDIATFNAAIEPMGLRPTHTPEEARARGRYVAENDERVDVLIARSVPTVDGVRVAFDDLWPRRRSLEVADDVVVAVPALPDLILTKRFGGRPKEEGSRSLIRWFRRRYPTPAARLAYARRAYRRWAAARPAR
jgi:hypothetical protein